MLYDGDCGLCKWLLAPLLYLDRKRRRLRPIALQRPEADALLADLEPTERMASWHLVLPDGSHLAAGAALPPALRLLPGGRLPAALLSRFPRLTERGYRWVAGNRTRLSRFIPRRAKARASRYVGERERQSA